MTSLTPLVNLPNLKNLYADDIALDCAEQGDTLDALCAKLLEDGVFMVDCGPQPSEDQSECPDY